MANAPQSRTSMSGGFLLAISLIVGVAIGTWKGQPSIGFVGGLALGVVLVLAVWLYDRRRG
jgi:hypothetical protein